MITTITVRKNNSLSRRIDRENEIRVDHEAPAQADEVASLIPQLVADQVLDLAELHRHHRLPVVLRHHRRVVAVGRHVNEAAGGDPEEFRTLGYDDGLAHGNPIFTNLQLNFVRCTHLSGECMKSSYSVRIGIPVGRSYSPLFASYKGPKMPCPAPDYFGNLYCR